MSMHVVLLFLLPASAAATSCPITKARIVYLNSITHLDEQIFLFTLNQVHSSSSCFRQMKGACAHDLIIEYNYTNALASYVWPMLTMLNPQ